MTTRPPTSQPPAGESLRDFLRGAAGDGPAVAVSAPAEAGLAPPPSAAATSIRDLRAALPRGVEMRTVDGRRMRTMTGFYREFAHAWRFPDYFGANKDAFDDCMRDLDGDTDDAAGDDARAAGTDDTPATAGFVTVITHAEELLADAPADDFDWFATTPGFYRDHYRDIARPAGVFAVILAAPADDEPAVRRRWLDAGVTTAVLRPAAGA